MLKKFAVKQWSRSLGMDLKIILQIVADDNESSWILLVYNRKLNIITIKKTYLILFLSIAKTSKTVFSHIYC